MKGIIPKFETEADEAKWWDEHLDVIEEEIAGAWNGVSAQILTRDLLVSRLRSEPLTRDTIRLSQEDAKRARVLADEKRVDYRTYVENLLHEALERESRKAS